MRGISWFRRRPKAVSRVAAFLPGDLVRITLPAGDICNDSHNGKGVVIYGPDDNDNTGWIVSSAPGSLRCVASELTMITAREDRES